MFDDPSVADIDHRLTEAKTQLAKLEDVGNDVRLARLREAVPNHPFFLLRTVGAAGSIIFVVFLIIAFAAPALHPEGARTLAALDVAIGLPAPLVFVVAAIVLGMLGGGSHQGAIMRAQSAPLLPAERKIQQDLLQKIMRLETKRDVAVRAPKERNPLLDS